MSSLVTDVLEPNTPPNDPPQDEPVAQPLPSDPPQDSKADVAPETYIFKAPEGGDFDPAVLDAYSGVAKELNLSQDAAQKVIDKVTPVLQARQAEQIAAVQDGWVNESRSDKEFGGDKLDENLGVAKKALDTFGTPELTELLKSSGLGNHPEVIRFIYRVGKATGDDPLVVGQGGSSPGQDARRLYQKSEMNP